MAEMEMMDPQEAAGYFTPSKKPDATWVSRIQPLEVGATFKVKRQEGEENRSLIRRINTAATSKEAGYKLLEWKQQNPNLPREAETVFIVRVKGRDTKSEERDKAKAELARKNGTAQAQQTTQGTESTSTPMPARETPSGPRRG